MHETITRRRFLGAAGLGLGTLLLRPPCLRGAERRLPEVSFIVITDTHLGYQDKERAREQWERTAAELARAPGNRVMHLGDVVDGGREPQYAVYLKIRDTIGKPVHEIPGNHDPAELFRRHIRDPIDTTIDEGWLRFLLLNNARPESHDGFLTAEQLAWIDAECRRAGKEDKFVALCMHVPAHANKHPDRGWYIKPDHGQKELYELLTRNQDRVLCLMHGHFHNGLRGWDDHAPVHEIVFPSALYNLDRRLEAQMAPGYNPSEFRPGYTLVSIKDGALRLRYQPVGAESQVGRDLAAKQLS